METGRADRAPDAGVENLHRLRRQIRAARGREATVFRRFQERYGSEVVRLTGIDERVLDAREREFGLEALVGAEDLSAWLRVVLERQVRSEAILLSALLDRYGEEGWALAKRAFAEHGRERGADERRRFPAGRPDELLVALEGEHLHGLPNAAPAFVERRADRIVVRRAACPNARVWNELGAPPRTLCALDRCWIDGFCAGFGAKVRHVAGPCIVAGAAECRDDYLCRPGRGGVPPSHS